MPTYEYQCTECNHRFDIWQNVGEAPPECPECGSAVKKVFHAPRVHFKGSGFYVTDLRAEKSAQKNNAKDKAETTTTSEAGASDNAATTETKTESKTETKSEVAPKTEATTTAATTQPGSNDKK